MAQSDLRPPSRARLASTARPRSRDDVRGRAGGPRRFRRSGGDQPPAGGDDQGPIWPPPGQPSATGARLEWPYFVLMLLPWIMLAAGVILNALNVCLMCLPADVPLPAIGP